MSKKPFKLILKAWPLLILGFMIVYLGLISGFLYIFAISETERVAAAEQNKPTATSTPIPIATKTPWTGPPPTVTRTPTLFPTSLATDVLAESGFPPGFTPTPRPTREEVYISLPLIFPANASAVDIPIINQIHYPEPFFPPGTNNACGPVALFAALQALRVNVDYSHLRNIAVNNGFTHYGISTAGMVNTVTTLNHELAAALLIEQGSHYSIKDLMRHIRQRGVVTVLIRVRKENGRYRVTADEHNSVGHFLIVDSINLRTGIVKFAGSTLGMDAVPLSEFIQSWSSNPQTIAPQTNSWQSYVHNEQTTGWALIIKQGP